MLVLAAIEKAQKRIFTYLFAHSEAEMEQEFEVDEE